MKKLLLTLCLFCTTINAMNQNFQDLYSLPIIQEWGTQLDQVSQQLGQYFLALTEDTPNPQMEAAYKQADEKFTKIQEEFAQWNQRTQTPEGLSMLNNLQWDHKLAMKLALDSRADTLAIIEMKYAGIRQQIAINARSQARSDESLKAACIVAGCGLILGAMYITSTYATNQNQ